MADYGPGSSMRRRYRAHGRVAERKQLKLKAIQRPMLKSPPSSSVGRRLSRVQWQSGGAEAASIEGHTQA
ncbi:unnamed protein product [Staurois parvus]|uniref:Uncharacterized protein n=2 Tax=Staurois parvus TaxID=386267 RepID=A0ABN9AS42_9NEOB|nr:unnamed protein product [Staurois parvus]